MRTLLNESLPPDYHSEAAFSPSEAIIRSRRIFSQNVVLSSKATDLAEVGVGGTVMTTPGADADSANSALERGMAPSCASVEQPSKEASPL
jgi:hypothetical protein